MPSFFFSLRFVADIRLKHGKSLVFRARLWNTCFSRFYYIARQRSHLNRYANWHRNSAFPSKMSCPYSNLNIQFVCSVNCRVAKATRRGNARFCTRRDCKITLRDRVCFNFTIHHDFINWKAMQLEMRESIASNVLTAIIAVTIDTKSSEGLENH